MKRVGMFVWNHFTNDARVMRECLTLSSNGYAVDLICIDDPNDPNLKRFERVNEHFHVIRLQRYPTVMLRMQSFRRFIRRNRLLLVGLLFGWGVLFCSFTVLTTVFTVLFLLLSHPLLKKLLVRLALFFRMVTKGYVGNYDIYHANDLNTLPQAYICAKWRFWWKRKSLIYDSHEVQTSRTGYNSRFYGVLEKILVKRVDAMIVENKTRAKYNKLLYGFYPYTLYNYPYKKMQKQSESVCIHEMLNIDKSEKILLYQGGIQQGRGLENIIRALPHFLEGTLVFIGDGKIKDRLQTLVTELNVEEKVHFIPKVPLEDLPKYTNTAYLGFQVLNNVCMNHWTASSNKLFEYVMSHVPVVASDFPEIRRVVGGYKVGVLVNSHDPLSIASGVNRLLSDRELYERCKANCHVAENTFNWEMEEQKLLDIYDKFY